MDDDVEGDPEDGDEIFDELMDGTSTRSSDVFETSWEIVSSSIMKIIFIVFIENFITIIKL